MITLAATEEKESDRLSGGKKKEEKGCPGGTKCGPKMIGKGERKSDDVDDEAGEKQTMDKG